ncbi:RNA polymerase sigma-70 factor [Pedobacter gandavensis]|uniref:RNA polymerase sigma factor n=1 Tax=Pedobacter gandavensis TaxID=2679963 RepID=UPI00292D6997|nr:RNA polymerase sigma-70 factor [Pedobacter gandavensis]
MMISLTEHSEEELAGLLKKNSEAAFSEIYRRYWDKLYVVSRKRLDDATEAEEIVQDVFCNLWRKRANFELRKGFNNYFSVAVKFEVINRLQKRTRTQSFEKNWSQELTEIDLSTQDQLSFNELKQLLELTIKSLPEKCQLVFRLKHDDGYSQKQISEHLEISEKTVEAHLSKARKTIKDKLGDFGILLFLINL